MKLTTTLLICFSFLSSMAQVAIEKVSHQSTCDGVSLDISIPILTAINQNDVLIKFTNDSIGTIFDMDKMKDEPCNNEKEEGDEFSEEEDEYAVIVNYSVDRNTKDFLSVVLNKTTALVGQGHGSDQLLVCFNLDFKTNQVVHMDSLFDPTNKKALEMYVRENLKKLEAEQEMSFVPTWETEIFKIRTKGAYESSFKGMSITSSHLKFYFKYNMGYSRYQMDSFQLSLKEIKPFIRDTYKWLCEK